MTVVIDMTASSISCYWVIEL